MSSLIIPCCGKSTRYSNFRPKFLLTAPSSDPMLIEGIKGLPLDKFDNVYIVVLLEHEEQYNFISGITDYFHFYWRTNYWAKYRNEEICGTTLHWVVLDSSDNQAHTIAQAIERENISGQIVIKDVDNSFVCDSIPEENFVGVVNLHSLDRVNAANKSYVQVNDRGLIQNIVEKSIISDSFCCGLYSFESAAGFLSYYNFMIEGLSSPDSNLYISHIIYKMLLDNIGFITLEASHYIDWSTSKEWMEYCNSFENIICDIDGCLTTASCPYMAPFLEDAKPIQPNIDLINNKYNEGCFIILMTARPERFRQITEQQLKEFGVKYHKLICGALHARRTIINDHAESLLYPACRSISLPRNSDTLKEYF